MTARAPDKVGAHDVTVSTGAPEPTRLIIITVHRKEPLPFTRLRRMEQLPLSGRQMQVFLLLTGGHSSAAIAERLSRSRHTVDYHCREVYARVDVHMRGELIRKLSLLKENAA
jgi:DNA-binding CsgD family transcriptional regulator